MINRWFGQYYQKVIAGFIACIFALGHVDPVCAKNVTIMPTPNSMVSLNEVSSPPLLKGVKVYTDNPFRLDFILDRGDAFEVGEEYQFSLQEESERLIKYFLASVTIPEKDLWVNLSPYEKDRIIPKSFDQTDMGQMLLIQDYMLKQMVATIIYPEKDVGKLFWNKVYAQVQQRFGTTDISMDTFNKVWIVPEKAVVYESKNSAYIVESKLKVMLETDYLAMSQNKLPVGGHASRRGASRDARTSQGLIESQTLAQEVFREVVIPILEKEVNEGKNFAQLRQIYHSLILAIWYKDKIKESFFGKAYVDQRKIGGIDLYQTAVKSKVWMQYVKSYKKGVFNYIKEEKDLLLEEKIPRKYFSGGVRADQIREVYQLKSIEEMKTDPAMLLKGDQHLLVEVNLNLNAGNLFLKSDVDMSQGISKDEGLKEKKEDFYMSEISTGGIPLEFISPIEKEILMMNVASLGFFDKKESRRKTFLTRYENKTLSKVIMMGDKHGDDVDPKRIVKNVEDFIKNHQPEDGMLEIVWQGDAFDKGDRNVEVFEEMRKLKKLEAKHPNLLKVALLWGNHDVWLVESVLLNDREAFELWMSPSAGGWATQESFYRAGIDIRELALFMLKNFELFYIDHWDMLHVHSWVPVAVDGGFVNREQLDELLKEWAVIRSNMEVNISGFLSTERYFKELKNFFKKNFVKQFFKGWRSNWYEYFEDQSKLNKFLNELNINGVFFAHVHMGANIGNKIFGIDVDDWDRGYFQMSMENGFEFIPQDRPGKEQIYSMETLVDILIGEKIGSLENTSKGSEHQQVRDMSNFISKTSQGDFLISKVEMEDQKYEIRISWGDGEFAGRMRVKNGNVEIYNIRMGEKSFGGIVPLMDRRGARIKSFIISQGAKLDVGRSEEGYFFILAGKSYIVVWDPLAGTYYLVERNFLPYRNFMIARSIRNEKNFISINAGKGVTTPTYLIPLFRSEGIKLEKKNSDLIQWIDVGTEIPFALERNKQRLLKEPADQLAADKEESSLAIDINQQESSKQITGGIDLTSSAVDLQKETEAHGITFDLNGEQRARFKTFTGLLPMNIHIKTINDVSTFF